MTTETQRRWIGLLVGKILDLPDLLCSARFPGITMPLCIKINTVKLMLLKHEASTSNERGVGWVTLILPNVITLSRRGTWFDVYAHRCVPMNILLSIKSIDCSTNLCLLLSHLKQGGKENYINPKGIKVMLLSFDNTRNKQLAVQDSLVFTVINTLPDGCMWS